MSKRVEQVKQSNAYRDREEEKKRKTVMVPVLDTNNKPLFPCKERRARALLKRSEAIVCWQKGIFCIKLVRKETEKREEYPAIALGIDPGSKREGYTVATEKAVVLNITSDTPDWVKNHMETRRALRRARRSRKTPYRACRENRATLKSANRIPPSTRSRWDAKLRMIKSLCNILLITIINVEDIKAISKEGKEKWNASFSPLEVGKQWFYSEVEKLGLTLLKTEGYKTKEQRVKRGFEKSREKLDYTWEAHNVDSHSLAEIALGSDIKPFLGMYKKEYLQYHRRQLQIQNPTANGCRKPYGSTVSLGMPRGSVVRYEGKLCYLGGSSKNMVSIHSIETGKRITQRAKKEEIKMLYTNSGRVQFLPGLKARASLHDLG